MTDETIMIGNVIGKTITDIRCKYGKEDDWLDTAECFIQLDNEFYIDIPYGQTRSALIIEPDADAETLFGDLSNIPSYHLNKENTTIAEVVKSHTKRKQNLFNRLRKAFFGYDPPVKEYQPYKVKYHENKLKHILNRTIVDYLWENDSSKKGIFELDNGYYITEQYMSPSGTGLAGLHYYDSLENLQKRKGENLNKYSDLERGNR